MSYLLVVRPLSFLIFEVSLEQEKNSSTKDTNIE